MSFQSMGVSGEDSEKTHKAMREMLGPQAIDRIIGQAISTCWMMLPEDKKTIEHLESEIRRIVDRAIVNLREDAKAFGVGPQK